MEQSPRTFAEGGSAFYRQKLEESETRVEHLKELKNAAHARARATEKEAARAKEMNAKLRERKRELPTRAAGRRRASRRSGCCPPS